MFSATWPESVCKLANDFLNNPMKVIIGSPDLSANSNVTHRITSLERVRLAIHFGNPQDPGAICVGDRSCGTRRLHLMWHMQCLINRCMPVHISALM